jgi:hypothetical protein
VAGIGLPAQGTQLHAWLRKKTRVFFPITPWVLEISRKIAKEIQNHFYFAICNLLGVQNNLKTLGKYLVVFLMF